MEALMKMQKPRQKLRRGERHQRRVLLLRVPLAPGERNLLREWVLLNIMLQNLLILPIFCLVVMTKMKRQKQRLRRGKKRKHRSSLLQTKKSNIAIIGTGGRAYPVRNLALIFALRVVEVQKVGRDVL